MAYVEVDKTRLTENMFSRKYSRDRRLYTYQEAVAFGASRRWSRSPVHWWVYEPQGLLPALPVSPLTPQARDGLERLLPF